MAIEPSALRAGCARPVLVRCANPGLTNVRGKVHRSDERTGGQPPGDLISPA